MNKIFILSLILSMITTLSNNAESSKAIGDLRTQIRSMEIEIQEHEILLQNSREEFTRIAEDLEESEKSINALEKEIDVIKRKIESSEQRIAALLGKKKELQGRIESQESALSLQIQASYRIGKQQTLKLILNQKNPNDFSST